MLLNAAIILLNPETVEVRQMKVVKIKGVKCERYMTALRVHKNKNTVSNICYTGSLLRDFLAVD